MLINITLVLPLALSTIRYTIINTAFYNNYRLALIIS